jgi:hypothetical protein
MELDETLVVLVHLLGRRPLSRKNLRTALFMNADDMRERGLDEFDLVDILPV